MKTPGAIWMIGIPILIAAITPVVAQFYSVDQYFWSAMIVAIGGAIVAAINAYRTQQSAAQPGSQPPGAAGAPMPEAPQRSFVSRWLLGG